MTIGLKLRIAREKRGFSTHDLARSCKPTFTNRQICAWESGANDILIGNLSRIADALGMTTSEILSIGEEVAPVEVTK